MKPGTQLGPYRVDSLIGAGGMGEVYLGVDTRLDRQVAIKILSTQLSENAELRERFEREARAISSLSHPNICTLFDVGETTLSENPASQGGAAAGASHRVSYLVMEYLQGESLADRIGKGPLRSGEVIRIGSEIANALDRAHKQGIIHRDLKPGNVMLTKSGVKLLDFGLAKISPRAGGAAGGPHSATNLATEQKPLTEQGAILGTFQYMAPEQLEGKDADARSDIFALGAILYEMVTGHRAFTGTSKASLIASIMDREPQAMSEIQPMTPPSLERLVRACLTKDPEERIQTAHDVALQLRWLSESSSVIEGPVVRRRKKVAPWVAAGLLGAAAIAASTLYWRERAKPAPPYTLSILPPAGHAFSAVSMSPDGKTLAFTARRREGGDASLWIRRIDDGTMRQLAAKSSGDAPAWSPDGRWLAFELPPSRLVRVRVDGGEPETICRTSVQGNPAWGSDGTILFTHVFGAGISRVPATGGEPRVLTKLDASRRESFHGNPVFLPEDKRFLFIAHTIADKRNEIWAGSLDGEKPHMVVSADALIGYSKPFLFFVRDGAIYAQNYVVTKGQVTGEARRVRDDTVVYQESEALSRATISPDGALVYDRFRPTRVLLNAYSRSGALLGTVWQGDDFDSPRLTSDEKTLVVSKWDPAKGASDVYGVELARGIATRLTSGLAQHGAPAISPDGQTIAYQSDREGMFDLYTKSIDGTSGDQALWKDDRDKDVGDWSPDGKYLLCDRYTPETKEDIWLVPTGAGEKPRVLITTEWRESTAVFSPDGRLFAYLSDQTGEPELYVRGFPAGRAIRVSTDGGGIPAFSADGRELLWGFKGRVMSAAIDTSSGTPQAGTPKQLFTVPDLRSRPFLAKDGRILLAVPAPGADTTFPVEFTTAWRSKLHN